MRASITLRRLQRLAGLLGSVMLGAALVRELRRPAASRTWHGELMGMIPYDLRPLSVSRLRHQLWNPRDSRVIVETAFGVGWTINLAALARRLTG